jgi:hypothetical protein
MTSSMGPRYSNRMVGFIVVAFERVAPGPVAESDYATQSGAIDLYESSSPFGWSGFPP